MDDIQLYLINIIHLSICSKILLLKTDWTNAIETCGLHKVDSRSKNKALTFIHGLGRDAIKTWQKARVVLVRNVSS